MTLDILDIKATLPHRYPFLLVDRVLKLTLHESIIALKNVTVNEPFFQGHFPTEPVMPGVLIIEALAQTSGILMMKSLHLDPIKHLFYLAGINSARFKRKVIPGDALQLNVSVEKARASVWKFKGIATVNGEVACETEFMNIKAKED